MSDRSDEALGARLGALAPSVDMVASRSLFERERRRPDNRPNRLLLPAAAVVLIIGVAAIWTIARPSGEPTGPISTIAAATTNPTATTELDVPTTTPTAPTTIPAVVPDPDPSTSPAPATSMPSVLPSGLTNWPPRSTDPVPVDAVPRLLPTVPVGDATTATAIVGTADTLGSYDYVQSWYDSDGGGFLVITSNIGQGPGTSTRGTTIDTDGWAATWNDAYVVPSATGRVSISLVSAEGVVQIDTAGLTEQQVIDIGRTLERRPSPEPGWNVPSLPADFASFGESGDTPDASRHLLWTLDDGTLIGELLVYSANANLLTTGWWPDEVTVSTIDLDGAEAVVLDLPGRVAIVWPLVDGGHALFGFTGSRADAEAIVRSLTVVDQETWDDSTEPPDPGRDGCESLFC